MKSITKKSIHNENNLNENQFEYKKKKNNKINCLKYHKLTTTFRKYTYSKVSYHLGLMFRVYYLGVRLSL